MKTGLHFLAFGASGTLPDAAMRLSGQARETGIFDSVSCELGSDFFEKWPDFRKHRPFIESNRRGWGYWIWKPYLCLAHLTAIPKEDTLFYLDAGCEILPENAGALRKLLDHAQSGGHLLFSYVSKPSFNFAYWTKQDLLDVAENEFGLSDTYSLPTFMSGAFAMKHNDRNIRFLTEWMNLCLANNYHFVDDTESVSPQKALFFEHRHDQSAFSIVAHAMGFAAAHSAFDYEYFSREIRRNPNILKLPILMPRNRTGQSIAHCSLYRRALFRFLTAIGKQKDWTPPTVRLAEDLMARHPEVFRQLQSK